MTTGSWVKDGRFWMLNQPPGHGSSFVGPHSTKKWSGGDAIKPSQPRSSYVGKRFRGKPVRRGPPLPPQNYSMMANSQYVGLYWARPNGYWTSMGVNPTWPSDISSPAQVDPKQEYKVISKIRDALYGSGFHPGVFTAEGAKSISLVGDSAYRIGSAINRLRARDPWGVAQALGVEPEKGFIRSLKDLRKGLSRSWLEIQYGWLPLLKDAEDGAKWMAEMVNGNTPVRVVKTRSWGETKVTSQSQAGTYLSARSDLFKLKITIDQVRARHTALPNLYSVAGVAWEILPYSFVFDWFVPVGSYLEALRTANDIEGRVVRSLKQETVWHDLVDGSGWRVQTTAPILQATAYKRTQFSRTVSSGLWAPPPISEQTLARIPEYTSWRHAMSAVALLAVGDVRRLWAVRE